MNIYLGIGDKHFVFRIQEIEKNRFPDTEMIGISRTRTTITLLSLSSRSGRMGVCLSCVMNNNISTVGINRCRLFIELYHITFRIQVPGNSSVIL